MIDLRLHWVTELRAGKFNSLFQFLNMFFSSTRQAAAPTSLEASGLHLGLLTSRLSEYMALSKWGVQSFGLRVGWGALSKKKKNFLARFARSKVFVRSLSLYLLVPMARFLKIEIRTEK